MLLGGPSSEHTSCGESPKRICCPPTENCRPSPTTASTGWQCTLPLGSTGGCASATACGVPAGQHPFCSQAYETRQSAGCCPLPVRTSKGLITADKHVARHTCSACIDTDSGGHRRGVIWELQRQLCSLILAALGVLRRDGEQEQEAGIVQRVHPGHGIVLASQRWAPAARTHARKWLRGRRPPARPCHTAAARNHWALPTLNGALQT